VTHPSHTLRPSDDNYDAAFERFASVGLSIDDALAIVEGTLPAERKAAVRSVLAQHPGAARALHELAGDRKALAGLASADTSRASGAATLAVVRAMHTVEAAEQSADGPDFASLSELASAGSDAGELPRSIVRPAREPGVLAKLGGAVAPRLSSAVGSAWTGLGRVGQRSVAALVLLTGCVGVTTLIVSGVYSTAGQQVSDRSDTPKIIVQPETDEDRRQRDEERRLRAQARDLLPGGSSGGFAVEESARTADAAFTLVRADGSVDKVSLPGAVDLARAGKLGVRVRVPNIGSHVASLSERLKAREGEEPIAAMSLSGLTGSAGWTVDADSLAAASAFGSAMKAASGEGTGGRASEAAASTGRAKALRFDASLRLHADRRGVSTANALADERALVEMLAVLATSASGGDAPATGDVEFFERTGDDMGVEGGSMWQDPLDVFWWRRDSDRFVTTRHHAVPVIVEAIDG
jgi:hypothetical protein